MAPVAESVRNYRIVIPLPPGFRFTHEPLDESSQQRFVGRDHELNTVVDRIVHSRGGAILITGYRGVGKTSFVNRALAELKHRCPNSRILPINLNLARPVTPLELMFLVLRCIYLELQQSGLWQELAPDVVAELSLAYQRTLMTIKETRSAASELSLNAPELDGKVAGAGVKAGSLFTAKRTRTRGNENTYLSYDERGAEYDLIHIARRLCDAWVGKTTWWQRFLHRSPTRKGDLRVIFVFDEMDKIEDPVALDDLFSMLKNVFTTSGLIFLFVAGKDIQERWGAEMRRGESIYESVFTHDVYLPCLWTDTRTCCTGPFAVASTPDAETVWRAISFQGRGIPRRILRSFHSFVRFEDDQPSLAVTPYEFRDAEFYAGLEEILESFRDRPSNLSDGDKRSLGLYYLIDWIRDRGTREFTLADAVAAYEALNTKLVFTGTMASQIEALIGALKARGYIEKVGRIDEKQFIKREDASIARYRITRSNVPESEARDSQSARKEVRFGPYLSLAPISSGGIGRVIRALDARSSEIVAVKYVRDPSHEVRAIFVRESEVLKEISHTSIPRFRAADIEGDTAWIAMDFVDAASLHRILLNRGRLTEEAAVYAITAVAQVCSYLHTTGYIYGDLKPSNVLVTRTGDVVLIDFSTARRVDASPAALGVFGTPAYMSPELLEGNPDSLKADLYALGVLSYELVCGRTPIVAGDDYEQLIARIRTKSFRLPSAVAPVSPMFEDLILRCIDPDPDQRPAGMPDVLATLSSLEGSQDALAREVGEMTAPAETRSEDEITCIPVGAVSVESQPPDPPSVTYRGPIAAEGPPTNMTMYPSSEAAPPPPAYRQNPGTAYPSPSLACPPEPPPSELSIRSPKPVASASLEVIPLSPEHSAARFLLRGSTTRIGRSFESEVYIDNPAFSRTHATITLENGSYWLRDAGSLNGTTVNGRKLVRGQAIHLNNEDRIEIGDVRFIFKAGSGTEQEPAA